MTAVTERSRKRERARIETIRREAALAREPGIGRFVVFGMLVIGLFVGGAGYWAASATLDGAVVAPAAFAVEGERKTVQHLDGGIVRRIHVRDGDDVKEGDVLVELDSTESDVEIHVLGGRLGDVVIRRARLVAQIAGRDIFDEAAAVARLDGMPEDAAWRTSFATQSQLFETERRARLAEREILDQRVRGLESQIAGLEEQRVANARQLEITRTELASLQTLFDKGLVAAPRLNAVRIDIERLSGADASLRTQQARAENDIGALRLTAVSQAKLRDEALSAELSVVETQLATLEPQYLGALARRRRIAVTAPASGKVVNMAIYTAGGVIRPGQDILDIVPLDEALIVKARINTADIDKLAVGQTTRVRLTAFADTDVPEAAGRIVDISADSLEDERTGEEYYEAKVALAAHQPETVAALELLPGMPADLFVNTGERTAMSYLVQPLKDRLARTFVE